jgi:hypothetical protein
MEDCLKIRLLHPVAVLLERLGPRRCPTLCQNSDRIQFPQGG